MRTLQEIVDKGRRIVFFGGAGVSTASGIPDFRGENGLYRQKYGDLTAEMMLSASFFYLHPDRFFEFYREHMLHPEARPNAAHRSLYKLERMGKLRGVVTQNIDGLHQKAGSRNVQELHGSIHRNYCMKCRKFYPPEAIRDDPRPVPLCTCGGRIKPDVVLYEEGLDDDVLENSVMAIRRADTLIVAGTSLTVYPAAGLLQYFRGKHLVLINRDATPMDDAADLVIHDKVGQVLSAITATSPED